MEPAIEHTGIVTAVQSGKAIVRIEQLSACAACHAKGMCTASDMKVKEIEAVCDTPNVQVGDRVVVTGQYSLGMKAVRLAFVYPAIAMVGMLFGVSEIANETAAAFCTLGALAGYYALLYAFRKRIGRIFIFNLIAVPKTDKNTTEN